MKKEKDEAEYGEMTDMVLPDIQPVKSAFELGMLFVKVEFPNWMILDKYKKTFNDRGIIWSESGVITQQKWVDHICGVSRTSNYIMRD